MSQDKVFKEEIKNASDFKFGATVANVFDDMVNRSVPYYGEMQRMTAELAADHAKEGSFVYDLGCSTGTTMIGMNTLVPESIEFIGISTHFATSDEIGSAFFDSQYKLFQDVVDKVREAGITVPIAHAANSGAILQRGKETAFDMVRPGIMLYGYAPSLELQQESRAQLQPVLEFTSAVAFTKRITKGEGVSYNLRWHAENDTNIATIPAGYGDGYPRLLTNKTNALINGKQYPVRGTICMDQILIETGNDQVRIGEEVILLSEDDPSIDAWTLASKIGTIPYEILTNITARVPRLVKK